MQKTARKNPPPVPQQTIQAANVLNPVRQMLAENAQAVTGITPYVGSNQFSYVGQTYQPTISWQDTTSNATYSSVSSVLNVT